jgi:hypothetical protein
VHRGWCSGVDNRNGNREFMRILRVFPRKTKATPNDDLVQIGEPDLFTYQKDFDYIYNPAVEIGFKAIDLIIKLSKNKYTKLHWSNQKHVMKMHCYFWVFQK